MAHRWRLQFCLIAITETCSALPRNEAVASHIVAEDTPNKTGPVRKQSFRIGCALLTFAIGCSAARLIGVISHPSAQVTARSETNPVQKPLPKRIWPEPRVLDLDLIDEDRLVYDSYLVTRSYKNVRIDEAGSKPLDVEVSYATLTRDGRILARFDNGFYHATGNSTTFGMASLLGVDTKQLVVSQSIWRGGDHWIVNLSPPARVIYSSREWGAGRENLRAVDLDYDGVDEILEEVTAFYDLQDKLAVSQIPLPLVVFKYDPKAKRFLPANQLHEDYLLRDISTAEQQVNEPAANNFNHLADVLDVSLQLIYAGREEDGWSFFDQTYQLPDKEEIRARVKADLKDQPVYDFIYQNHRNFKHAAELSLPRPMSSALDRRFPGWKYAEVDEEIRKFLKEAVSSFARPDIISGDFDGDGAADYAVLIEQKLPVRKLNDAGDRKFYLVVFLKRAAGFKMHVLDPEGAYLGLMRRGDWDYDYDIQAHFTYQNDAIFTGIFEKGGTSYVYRNGKFHTIITSD